MHSGQQLQLLYVGYQKELDLPSKAVVTKEGKYNVFGQVEGVMWGKLVGMMHVDVLEGIAGLKTHRTAPKPTTTFITL